MSGRRPITALDFADPAELRAFVARLDPSLTRVKIGNEAFTVGGPALVDHLQELGFDVFLDLKYHDIPNTVASAVARAASLGVWMLNVHAGGGRRMLEAAREAVERVGRGAGGDVAGGAIGGAGGEARDGAGASGEGTGDVGGTRLIGVTVLTSLERADLAEVGLDVEPAEHVARLAALVRDAGLDGVVCSPRELPIVRALAPDGFLTVTPGIRPRAVPDGADTRAGPLAPGGAGPVSSSVGTTSSLVVPGGAGSGDAGSRGATAGAPTPDTVPADDQRRTLTPREAILAGADHLVVGRPVTRAADPLAALHALVDEIDAAVFERRHTNTVPGHETE